MIGPTRHQFERELTAVSAERGYKEAIKQRFKEMQSRQVPVVFSLMHLSVLSGVRWARLRSIVQRERLEADYQVYPKRKSSGATGGSAFPRRKYGLCKTGLRAIS